MKDFINKLIRYPEVIPCDKRIHALVGAILTSGMMLFGLHWVIAVPIVAVLGILVEVYQKLSKSGQYDNYDALAVVIGAMIVALPLMIKGL